MIQSHLQFKYITDSDPYKSQMVLHTSAKQATAPTPDASTNNSIGSTFSLVWICQLYFIASLFKLLKVSFIYSVHSNFLFLSSPLISDRLHYL